MKGVMAIIGVGVIVMMLGAIMWGIKDFRGDDFTEPHIITTTAETSAIIVLANEVLDDSTVNISITSNNSDDAPIPYHYASNGRQLTITGLNDNDSRTMSVEYAVPTQNIFVDVLARYFPVFLILGLLAIVVGVIVIAVQNARGR